ncbi:hypothetical protein X474_19915 [Dethiosulfatarculus sandiegensis]|uniref:Uncharacterized protein n=1 Tax=Dethiosulfatarculus sandiegensis TaxID=1429043 RepID=A0A0D2HNZ5_9BACT|nr:hypothetical protein X474_19915 [Dethiosulfatarculus sandiegensis]
MGVNSPKAGPLVQGLVLGIDPARLLSAGFFIF